MELQFKKAVRKSVPLIMSISGTSGSGKTYSAILLAAGLAGPNGKVGFIDTENQRGCFYADSPGIMAALPQGFQILDLDAPFSPSRYIEAIDAAEKAGINVLVIDSGSHEWEGTGGCSDIAEKDKGRWNNAKRANRKYVYRLLYSTMHIIVCLRAREKSKIIPKNESASGREEVLSLGVLPVCEKNFVYEMLLSIQLDERTHNAMPVKVPEPLMSVFAGSRMITKADGEKIRQWNETGSTGDQHERLTKQARAAAQEGMESYKNFFSGLTPTQKKSLDASHAENKAIAERIDREASEIPTYATGQLPDAFDVAVGAECWYEGKKLRVEEIEGEGPSWKTIGPQAA